MPAQPTLDRLVRKEVGLGTIRSLEPPREHIGTRLIAPWLEVPTDDVIFDYAVGLSEGLAPARAEDAEAQLYQMDDIFGGQGRASVIDWSLKNRYSASDVNRYRESLGLQARLGISKIEDLPITVRGNITQFQDKIAKDDVTRRNFLDNRVEWLIMSALANNQIVYNDGRIKFTQLYNRPANQNNQAPAGGVWSGNTSDPIGDILKVQDFMYDTYGIRITRALTSRKVINSIMNSERFIARSGMVNNSTSSPVDLNYLGLGWGSSAAKRIVEEQTGLTFIEYDSVLTTRLHGSTQFVNTRFTDQDTVYFLPSEESVNALDDAIGFGRTLTSPHPEGNWQPGFYEWEEETKDPWSVVRGSGVKAFPVFPHMDWTYTMKVL